MIFILVMFLCTLVALLFLLDFIMRNYTTYGIAKDMQGPYMWPIIGAVNFFLSPQGDFSIFKLFYVSRGCHLICIMLHLLQIKHSRSQRNFVINSKMVSPIGHSDFSSIKCIQLIRLRF